ncbi:MAG: DUF1732 domain-containing protein [Flavobacteriaceae bacterium]|nr:DUF1732 domain-containing protein [Flavobacteriaceae bacterium]
MTGYSSMIVDFDCFRLHMELRSLNSKAKDITLRLPSFLYNQENEYRKALAKKLHRGKIDLCVKSVPIEGTPIQKINSDLIKTYMAIFRSIHPSGSDDILLGLAVKMPDIWSNDPVEELSCLELEKLRASLDVLIENLLLFQTKEGAVLFNVLSDGISNIESLLNGVVHKTQNRKSDIATRIKSMLLDADVDFDEKRMEQELLYYLEKSDITEELVRLQSHLTFFKEVLSNSSPNGKKLTFISQEIGRELNTIGAKIQNASIQRLVVDMKDQLEKIKEQLSNII